MTGRQENAMEAHEKLESDPTIPVMVGVTGHCAVREADGPALRAAVRAELLKLKEMCPHSRLVMLNSLARGGDLLCADVAESLGIPLVVILPRERADYEQDFEGDEMDRARFSHHCQRAEQVLIAPPVEEVKDGCQMTRDMQYRQAGLYVAVHSHVLLALWDGVAAQTEDACGTAGVVAAVMQGCYRPVSGAALRSEGNQAVIHIFTPRDDGAAQEAGTVRLLGKREALLDVLLKTDEFNQSVQALPAEEAPSSRPLQEEASDPLVYRMQAVGRAADALSGRYALKYRRILVMLAIASALLTFAFLMYDEAEAIWMILICGLMLLCAWKCQRVAARTDCHRRYIEYRALAEGLRVQSNLRYAGSRIQTADLLSWTQREETAWVMTSLCAMTVGEDPEKRHDILHCWVEDQQDYHRRASVRGTKKLITSERTLRVALVISVALYLAAVAFELVFGGLSLFPALRLDQAEVYRTVLKIVLGTISVGTLFVANYYGKLSLSRTVSDHQKMERFYSQMASQIRMHGQTEALLRTLAREELIENGNWVSYQRDNTPDMNV